MRTGVGVIGCGNISPQYLDNLVRRFEAHLNVVAISDLDPERARSRAEEYGIKTACRTQELLADPSVEIVVNLTVPGAHYEVSRAALEAGKHVYTEKPLAVTREEGRALVELAASNDLRLGGAPDTFLGTGLQTSRKLLDSGELGRLVTATALIAMGVPVPWYHKVGVGPMFDMGPYYLTALVALLGPAVRVTGSARIPFATKVHDGEEFSVDTPTAVCGIIDFANGTNAVVTTTSEVFHYRPRLELYGAEGMLTCNDPNMFGGPVLLEKPGGGNEPVELLPGFSEGNRGLGVADMALAIREGRPHRASGDLMFHVHDIMHGIHEASVTGGHVALQSTCERPAPLDVGPLL